MSATIDGVEPGQNYQYVITNGDVTLRKNDPRGLALTASDHGFSVVVNDEFDWQNDQFTPPPPNQQIIYELHVGTFNRPDPATTGTFETAIEKLDYLRDLGVNMIELMPITSMAFSNGWGYAPNYLYSVESMLGGRYGLMLFVRECHKRGIGVILDVVYNHFTVIPTCGNLTVGAKTTGVAYTFITTSVATLRGAAGQTMAGPKYGNLS